VRAAEEGAAVTVRLPMASIAPTKSTCPDGKTRVENKRGEGCAQMSKPGWQGRHDSPLVLEG
jgi:hypothetical protein